MIVNMHLSCKMVETTCAVGPFFWWGWDKDMENPRILTPWTGDFWPETYWHMLERICRKSDAKENDKSLGWELSLSHEIRTGITTGVFKATPNHLIDECLNHLKTCASEINHPMLFPIIIYCQILSSTRETQQPISRDWLKKLQQSVGLRARRKQYENQNRESFIVNLHEINRNLIECHSSVLWKRPAHYIQIIESLQEGIKSFYDKLCLEQQVSVQSVHNMLEARLEFSKERWEEIEIYTNTTMQRLELQRNAVSYPAISYEPQWR